MSYAVRRILRRVGISLLFALMLVLFSGALLLSEDKKAKKEPEPKSQTIFRVPVNIMVVNATVTDKDGNPVTDLTSKDFRVFDDGKPQDIQTFALEAYGPAEFVETTAPGATSKTAATPQKTDRPRIISIVLDDLAMESVVNFPRMINAVREFVEKDMGPRDQVTLLSGSGRLQVPFTDNKQRLLDELALAGKKINFSPVMRETCPKLTDLEAWRFADGMHEFQVDRNKLIQATMQCLNLTTDAIGGTDSYKKTAEAYLRAIASSQRQTLEFQTRNMLSTLRQHIRTLKHFDGAKTIVLFSDGFLSESESPEAYQLQEVIDLALRSGIILNTVSIRGLSVEDSDAASQENKQAKESPLSQIAYETGGMFSHSRNDLYKGIQEIARRQSYYYILSYALPARKADGSHHKIKLELTRPDLKISYRKGYYVQKEEQQFENNKKEDIIDALNAPGNMREIPMTLSYNYSQGDESAYSVSFITRTNIRGIQFLDEDSRRKNMVSFILAAFDENDKYIDGIDKSIEFRLLEENYASLRDRGLTSRVELKLPIGRYKIKAVVREANQSKMGSVTKFVEIP
jgi:VWFA-related protein